MAKVTFVQAAQKDIYTIGKDVEYVSKKGKREGQTLTKRDRTIPADENDPIYIKKGEPYYWWAFQYRPKQFSKERPRASQTTNSPFLSAVYAIQERIEDCSVKTKEDFDSFKEDIMSDIESLKDECQEKLDGMPDQLQSAPSGEMLQNRIDELESWYSEIENIYCEEPSEEENDEDESEGDEEEAGELNEVPYEVTMAIEELQNTSYNGE